MPRVVDVAASVPATRLEADADIGGQQMSVAPEHDPVRTGVGESAAVDSMPGESVVAVANTVRSPDSPQRSDQSSGTPGQDRNPGGQVDNPARAQGGAAPAGNHSPGNHSGGPGGGNAHDGRAGR